MSMNESSTPTGVAFASSSYPPSHIQTGPETAQKPSDISVSKLSLQPVDDAPHDGQDNDQHSIDPNEDTTSTVQPDIEHVRVDDDPRTWSAARKNFNLALVAYAALAPACAVYIYNTAFLDIKAQLHATDNDIALSLSMFILVQGGAPLIWSAFGEIYGRKIIYLTALTVNTIGNIGAATSKHVAVLIVMRLLQAGGAAAAFTMGGGVIADMYESHERGTRMGIFFAIPMLGPSLGPIIGGVLVQYFDWRATFWFLSILGGLSLFSFIFFKETFRKERSQAYQVAVKRAIQIAEEKESRAASRIPSAAPTIKDGHVGHTQPTLDLEKAVRQNPPATEVKLSLADVNPIHPSWIILRQRTNMLALYISSIFMGVIYGICYTAARTFARPPYSFNPLIVGVILFTFGIGNTFGSVLGGRWSDRALARLKAANGGESRPEMRLQSTIIGMAVLPFPIFAYGWMCHYHVHVAGPVVVLFIGGFASIWVYSASLAYVVDANVGRASTAVAVNSFIRGIAGMISAEISGPLQDSIGDGGLYTFWTGMLLTMIACMFLLMKKGDQWRVEEESKRAERRAKRLADDQAREINGVEKSAYRKWLPFVSRAG